MTLEELKAEAKKQGFKLMPIKEQEKLLPCTCGSKRREHWSRWAGDHIEITLCCSRCGKRASGATEAEARHNWNEMILAEDRRKRGRVMTEIKLTKRYPQSRTEDIVDAYMRGWNDALDAVQNGKFHIADRKTEPQICDTCRYYSDYIPCGSTPSACKEADKFAKEFVNGLKDLRIIEAGRKDEPSGYKTKPVEDEPQTPYDNCKECKWWSPIRERCITYDECHFEPIPIIGSEIFEDEPQEREGE